MHHSLGPGSTQAAPGNHNHNKLYATADHIHLADPPPEPDSWHVPVLMNGWEEYPIAEFAPRYKKFPGGLFIMTGLVKNQSDRPIYDYILQLPVGYRPIWHTVWATPIDGVPNMALELATTGILEIYAPYIAPAWISLHLVYGV